MLVHMKEGSPNTTEQREVEQTPEGERWLKMMGYGGLIGKTFTHKGKTVLAQNVVDEFCYDFAAPMLRALEAKDPADPSYEEDMTIARSAVQFYCGDLIAEQAQATQTD